MITDVIPQSLVCRALSTELDDPDEASYVMGLLLPAAWEACASFVDRRVYATKAELPTGDDAKESDMVASNMFVHAVLLTLGDYYLNREDQEVGSMTNRAVYRILFPLRQNLSD